MLCLLLKRLINHFGQTDIVYKLMPNRYRLIQTWSFFIRQRSVL